jgi:flagellin-specific chaperone FliS
MNPYARYRQQAAPAPTRIDSLLSLLDAACERSEKAAEAMAGEDAELARSLRTRARLVVLGLWSGVDVERGGGAREIVSLYQYVANALATGTLADVRGACEVLNTLREGFRGIREEGVELERAGVIPPHDAICAVFAVG